jgi:hypothetical protein
MNDSAANSESPSASGMVYCLLAASFRNGGMGSKWTDGPAPEGTSLSHDTRAIGFLPFALCYTAQALAQGTGVTPNKP